MPFGHPSGNVDENRSYFDLPDTGTRLGASYMLLNSGNKMIYTGGPTCIAASSGTPNAGFPLRPGVAIPINLNGSDRIYFICAAGETSSWHFLKQGV